MSDTKNSKIVRIHELERTIRQHELENIRQEELKNIRQEELKKIRQKELKKHQT